MTRSHLYRLPRQIQRSGRILAKFYFTGFLIGASTITS